jgi:2,3-bisphosphoglycerate-dependent phosphoglycerate mutase
LNALDWPGMASESGHRELWLVRHGETPASRALTLAGWANVPLTGRGEDQASDLRPLLAGERFKGVWSSDLLRAVETARLAWGEARQDARLREMSFGSLEGRPWASLDPRLEEAFVRFEGFAAPGGETFEDFRARVLSFLDDLPPGRHLVFTHGGVVRLLSREVGEDYFVPTGSLLVLDWDARRLLSRRDGEGEASRSLPVPAGSEEGR